MCMHGLLFGNIIIGRVSLSTTCTPSNVSTTCCRLPTSKPRTIKSLRPRVINAKRAHASTFAIIKGVLLLRRRSGRRPPPSASVRYKSSSLVKEQGVQGLRPLCCVAERGRRGDQGPGISLHIGRGFSRNISRALPNCSPEKNAPAAFPPPSISSLPNKTYTHGIVNQLSTASLFPPSLCFY